MPSVTEMALLKLDPVGAFTLTGQIGLGFHPQVVRVSYPDPYLSDNLIYSRTLVMVHHGKKRALVCFGPDVMNRYRADVCPPFKVFEALATGLYRHLFEHKDFHPAHIRFSDFSDLSDFSTLKGKKRSVWGGKISFSLSEQFFLAFRCVAAG